MSEFLLLFGVACLGCCVGYAVGIRRGIRLERYQSRRNFKNMSDTELKDFAARCLNDAQSELHALEQEWQQYAQETQDSKPPGVTLQ